MLFYHHFRFNSESNVVTNLNHFNPVNKSFRLCLIIDSESSTCRSGLKEFNILAISVLT